MTTNLIQYNTIRLRFTPAEPAVDARHLLTDAVPRECLLDPDCAARAHLVEHLDRRAEGDPQRGLDRGRSGVDPPAASLRLDIFPRRTLRGDHGPAAGEALSHRNAEVLGVARQHEEISCENDLPLV